jgi:Glycine-zipper domain
MTRQSAARAGTASCRRLHSPLRRCTWGLQLASNRRLNLVRPLLALGAAGWICTAMPAFAGEQYAQYYPPPRYGPPPGYRPPPCHAVTPGPFSGAARGAAGGALIGAISGNAGRGAGIGAAVGGIGGAIRRGSARNAGACY